MSNTSFSKGNANLRSENYDQAFDNYLSSILENPEFLQVYINLSYLIKKSNIKGADLNSYLKKVAASDSVFEEKYKLVKESKFVNGKWYLNQYSKWIKKGCDPILHYMIIGWRLGFNPCKRFNNNFYKKNYCNDVNSRYEIPLIHYLKFGKKKGYKIHSGEDVATSNLGIQLWNGHSITALKELKMIYRDHNSSSSNKWWALWHTARWTYFIGDFNESLNLAHKMTEVEDDTVRKETAYLKYFSLLELGRKKEAHESLLKYIKQNPNDADAVFALSNSVESSEERVKIINNAYGLYGFSGISIKSSSEELSFDTVTSKDVKIKKEGKKVSIIMPIYSASDQVKIAIESLLNQTYSNIEIIAVDDCSPDNTFEVLKEIEMSDTRVKAVQPPENGGAYAARNYGLKFATGDLITTHDSDDWSHPQKLECQVKFLEENPNVKGCSAHWIRARKNLSFTQNWRPNNALIHWSQSSFMFYREVIETIGEWDYVRIGGDTEYIWRMQAKFGKDSFAKIYPQTPLAFALDEESSLTRTKATHVRTVYFGLRHIYREICSWWHENSQQLSLNNAKDKRAFPAPRSMYERSDNPIEFDVVLAGDYSREKDCELANTYLSSNHGKKIALFHWPSFNKKPEKNCNKYFEMLVSGNAEAIVMGQLIAANEYILLDKDLEMYELDGYPDFISFNKWEYM